MYRVACQCDHSLPSTQAKQVRGNMAVDDTTTCSCVSHNRQCKAGVRRSAAPSNMDVACELTLGFQPVCQCVCLGISGWVSSNVITTMLSLGGLSVCLCLLANVITACRLGGIRCLQLCVSQAKQVWGNMAVPSNLVTNTSKAGVCEARSSRIKAEY